MKLDPSRPLVRFGAMALGALIAASITTGAWAQWKWRDSGGRVQYSDLPPPASVPESNILSRPSGASRSPMTPPPAAASAPVAAAAGSAAAGSDPALEAKRKQAEDAEAAKRKAEEDKVKAAKADNCARAKAHLRTLDNGMRIARINEKGEREILDDKQRAAETQRTRAIVTSDCQ